MANIGKFQKQLKPKQERSQIAKNEDFNYPTYGNFLPGSAEHPTIIQKALGHGKSSINPLTVETTNFKTLAQMQYPIVATVNDTGKIPTKAHTLY